MLATSRSRICWLNFRRKPILEIKCQFLGLFVKKQFVYRKVGKLVSDENLNKKLQKLNKTKCDFVNFAEFLEIEGCVLEKSVSQEEFEIRQFDHYFSDLEDIIKVPVGGKTSVCLAKEDINTLNTRDSRNEGTELQNAKRRSSFFSSLVEGLKIQCKAYLMD